MLLDKTRLIKTKVHRHQNKELISNRLDDLLIQLDGNIYDVRDYVYNFTHINKKKEIYDYLQTEVKTSNTTLEEVAALNFMNSLEKSTPDYVTNNEDSSEQA